MPQTDPDIVAREALRLIGPDPQNWVPERDGVDHNVVVVGGGQSGSAFAFALRRAGVGKVSVIDAAPDNARAGVWRTSARMHKLRTPKNLPGPELGLPGLSFQAWYETRHGAAAYDALDRIPRLDWAAYLDWYRKLVGVPVRYSTRLVRIEPAGDHLRLHLEKGGATRVETTRKLILASGFAGSGGAFVPDVVTQNVPKSGYAHTSERIDFEALRGKSVAVLGSAASAFDAAAVALEAEAREVHLFARRDNLASLPVIRIRGYPGAYDNYAASVGSAAVDPGIIALTCGTWHSYNIPVAPGWPVDLVHDGMNVYPHPGPTGFAVMVTNPNGMSVVDWARTIFGLSIPELEAGLAAAGPGPGHVFADAAFTPLPHVEARPGFGGTLSGVTLATTAVEEPA